MTNEREQVPTAILETGWPDPLLTDTLSLTYNGRTLWITSGVRNVSLVMEPPVIRRSVKLARLDQSAPGEAVALDDRGYDMRQQPAPRPARTGASPAPVDPLKSQK
jgi:hypothetical protein